MSSRVDEIKKIIAMAPGDPFPRYGLAMEYKNTGLRDEAHEAFTELRRLHPEYVAQYLMHGNLLIEMKRRDEAREVLRLGVEAARQARNAHALGEIQAALDGLEDIED